MEAGSHPASVVVRGTTAYVVNQTGNILPVFNVATPSVPVLPGAVSTGINPFSVTVSGTTAYVGQVLRWRISRAGSFG